jgi:hypothetical protein
MRHGEIDVILNRVGARKRHPDMIMSMDAASKNLRLRTPSRLTEDDVVARPPSDLVPVRAAAGPHIYYPTRYVVALHTKDDMASYHFITPRIIILGSALLAIVSAAMFTWLQLSQALENLHWYRAEPRWIWDHNIYDPRGTLPVADSAKRSRKLLILQHATSPQMAKILDVTSRVNRAYAKHLEADYVRIDGLGTLCDVIFNVITMKIASEDAWLQYDVILAMTPDAVFVDFDVNVLALFLAGNNNNLVGIAGNTTSIDQLGKGLLFWNTRHQESSTVLKLWRDNPTSARDIGLSIDDITTLFDLLRKAYNQEELFNMVQELKPPQVDFFSGNLIKFFRQPPDYEPMSRLKWLESESEDVVIVLEQLVDSICFKYYPKCELA